VTDTILWKQYSKWL